MTLTLGQMIAALGSTPEWNGINPTKLLWDDDNANLYLPMGGISVGTDLDAKGDIRSIVWQEYTPTFVGFNPSTPSDWAIVYWKKIGRLVLVYFNFYGTSNSTDMKISLPTYAIGLDLFCMAVRVWNNSGNVTTPGMATITSGDVGNIYFYKDFSGATFTNSNKKGAFGQIWYESQT